MCDLPVLLIGSPLDMSGVEALSTSFDDGRGIYLTISEDKIDFFGFGGAFDGKANFPIGYFVESLG